MLIGDGTLLDANFSDDGKKLAFISSTRDHKEAHLQIADVKTGNIKSVFTEVTKTYYESGVSGENWRVFFDSNEFLWYSEKDNWGHLYLHDLKTGKLKIELQKVIGLLEMCYTLMNHQEKSFSLEEEEEGNPIIFTI